MSDALYCSCGHSTDDGAALAEHIEEAGEGHVPASEPESAEEMYGDDTEHAEPLEGLYPRQVSIHGWRVLSHRNDSQTAHKVDVRTLECTCGDHRYNIEDGSQEVCDHVAAVLETADTKIDVGTALNYDLHQQVTELSDAVDYIDQKTTAVNADTQADSGSSGGSDGGSQPDEGTPRPEAEAQEAEAESAAETLQEAFDEVLDDMQVQTSAGHVWFKTGYDTEEEWPFPGGDETFKVITSPDCVKYVHDGSDEWADSPHPLYEDMPGEYFKNALEPGDVEEYIGEVLE